MSLVLDSSMALAWCFEDERTPAAQKVLAQVAESGAIVPGLWRFEVANGLQMAVRRQRIDGEYRDRMLTDLAALDVRLDSESEAQAWSASVQLAATYQLTVYDAAYLELAQRRRLPLASLDKALQGAAAASKVVVLG